MQGEESLTLPPTILVFEKSYKEYDEWYYRNKVIAENELKAIKKLGLKGLGLEIGVGTGWFASRLGIDYGLDPSINMLKIAKSRGVDSIAGVGESIPIRDSALDYVLIVVTLCFVDNPVITLLEARRILRNEGVLGVCIVPRDSIWGQYYLEKSLGGHQFYSVAKFYSTMEVKNMLHMLGFKIDYIVSTLSFTPFDEPSSEQPSTSIHGGFICIRAVKTLDN